MHTKSTKAPRTRELAKEWRYWAKESKANKVEQTKKQEVSKDPKTTREKHKGNKKKDNK